MHINRNPKILAVYDDLSRAAENGLDPFINKLKNLEIEDRKLRTNTEYFAESIEEAINDLKTNLKRTLQGNMTISSEITL